jgi:hypothetical protein
VRYIGGGSDRRNRIGYEIMEFQKITAVHAAAPFRNVFPRTDFVDGLLDERGRLSGSVLL